jgi:hypothetical protein
MKAGEFKIGDLKEFCHKIYSKSFYLVFILANLFIISCQDHEYETYTNPHSCIEIKKPLKWSITESPDNDKRSSSFRFNLDTCYYTDYCAEIRLISFFVYEDDIDTIINRLMSSIIIKEVIKIEKFGSNLGIGRMALTNLVGGLQMKTFVFITNSRVYILECSCPKSKLNHFNPYFEEVAKSLTYICDD